MGSEASKEQRQAGIADFDRFGVFNTIDSLAGGDILKWGEVMKLVYNEVFLKLCMNKQQHIFQENLRTNAKVK